MLVSFPFFELVPADMNVICEEKVCYKDVSHLKSIRRENFAKFGQIWFVKISLNSGEFHFHASIGALFYF